MWKNWNGVQRNENKEHQYEADERAQQQQQQQKRWIKTKRYILLLAMCLPGEKITWIGREERNKKTSNKRTFDCDSQISCLY